MILIKASENSPYLCGLAVYINFRSVLLYEHKTGEWRTNIVPTPFAQLMQILNILKALQ
jgi:hypothetical protein